MQRFGDEIDYLLKFVCVAIAGHCKYFDPKEFFSTWKLSWLDTLNFCTLQNNKIFAWFPNYNNVILEMMATQRKYQTPSWWSGSQDQDWWESILSSHLECDRKKTDHFICLMLFQCLADRYLSPSQPIVSDQCGNHIGLRLWLIRCKPDMKSVSFG